MFVKLRVCVKKGSVGLGNFFRSWGKSVLCLEERICFVRKWILGHLVLCWFDSLLVASHGQLLRRKSLKDSEGDKEQESTIAQSDNKVRMSRVS